MNERDKIKEREAFEKWLRIPESSYGSLYDVWQAACAWQKAQDDELIQLLKTKLYKAEAEPVIQEGMQLVPARPTLAMVLATGFNEQESRDCYKAMINAYKEKQK